MLYHGNNEVYERESSAEMKEAVIVDTEREREKGLTGNKGEWEGVGGECQGKND